MRISNLFPFFTLVSEDEARVSIAVGGAVTERATWSQDSADFSVDDTRQMQSHIYEDRPIAIDVTIAVSAEPAQSTHRDWLDVCDVLGYLPIAPAAQGGQPRVLQIIAALREERKRVWTVYSARHGELPSYVIVSCSDSFDASTGCEISLSLKRVEFSSTEVVSIPAAPPPARHAAAKTVTKEDTGTCEVSESDYYSSVEQSDDRDIFTHMADSGEGNDSLEKAIDDLGTALSDLGNTFAGGQ